MLDCWMPSPGRRPARTPRSTTLRAGLAEPAPNVIIFSQKREYDELAQFKDNLAIR